MKTDRINVQEYQAPAKMFYVAPRMRSLALHNENVLCSSPFDGNNEGLTEDETGNDYD